ncbi:MAG: glycosyltransferase, partial [Cyanobacteria bacterium P01_H01_bin.121]
MTDFSVIIATYNGASRLPEVLECLRRQVISESVIWEVIVVDNNSIDRTKNIVSSYISGWRADSQLRYAFEPQQGAAYARYLGVKVAKTSSLMGFLDDDNLPAENWVEQAVKFGKDDPQIGAYGGIIHAKLDT